MCIVVKIIFGYNRYFYNRYKIKIYFGQHIINFKKNNKTTINTDIIYACNHIINR